MTIVHLDDHTRGVVDRVERLTTTLDTIQTWAGIPPHTDLHVALGEASTFLTSQRRLLVAHLAQHSAIVRELMKLYPEGLPNDLRQVVFTGIEI